MTTISMTTEYPNRALAYEALNPYRDAMRDFIVEGLRSIEGDPRELIKKVLPSEMASDFDKNTGPESQLKSTFEEAHFPHIVKGYWEVFRELLVNNYDKRGDFQNLLWDIKSHRNSNTHHGYDVKSDISIDRAKRMIEAISKVLRTIQKESAADEVDRYLQQVTGRNQEIDNRANELNRIPWREAIEPHPDIIDGLLMQSQFAANLQEVYDGRAEDTIYGNPVMFFRHTYLTEGMTNLLREALRRLAGQGSHPIIQAQTGFGGGKTHSLIALYHMVKSGLIVGNTSEEAEDQENRTRIREIFRDSGVGLEEELKPAVSVLHGTYLAPTDNNTTIAGDPLNTLWGVMAYQLAGQTGYDIIGQAARTGSPPGGQQLATLFHEAGPSLILVDEIVNYARALDETQIDRLYTFFQTLTDAIPATKNVVMVVALPASEREQGDSRGVEITRRLETIMGRVQAVWRPVEDREGFEVIRRRLFQDSTCDEEVREAVCKEFRSLYGRSNLKTKLPDEAKTEDYIQRIKASYPIHPEVFDRIFDDWSTYANFQRTRGSLRMMALFVHHLYYSDNRDPLIMPGNLPFFHGDVSGEFLTHLGENWNPVITEVDSVDSRVRAIDARNATSRQSEIAQRIARTIFFGSMPERQYPGLSDRQIRLGVVTPGISLNNYDSALKSIEDQLYYIYRKEGRRHFSSDINVDRAFEHRRGIFQNEDDDGEIAKRIRDLCSDDRIVVCPETTEEVPDEPVTRTVILWPEFVYSPNSRDTASADAKEITIYCGEGQPRRFPNALLFNAMHGSRQANLRRIARRIQAWESLVFGGEKIEHLNEAGKRRAEAEINAARQELDQQLAYAYDYVAEPILAGNDDIMFKWEAVRFVQGHRLEEEIPKFMDSTDSRWFAKHTDSGVLEAAKQAIEANKPDHHATVNDVIALLATDLKFPRMAGLAHVQSAVTHLVNTQAVGYANSYDPDSGVYVGLVVANDQVLDNISMTDLLIDPEAGIASEKVQMLAQPRESNGNDPEESTDQPELEVQAAEDILSIATQAEPPEQQDEQAPDQWTDTKSPIAALNGSKLPGEENKADNPTEYNGESQGESDDTEEPTELEVQAAEDILSTVTQAEPLLVEDNKVAKPMDYSNAIQNEIPFTNEHSRNPAHTVELIRYTPQNATSHLKTRAFINQTINDLREAGVIATVRQETTITTFTELTNVPANIETNGDNRNNSEITKTEIVITLLTLADVPEETIRLLREHAGEEGSIKLQV